jgi:uncharacterized protein YjiS (DUF1127 family)
MSIAETAKHDLVITHQESGTAKFLARAVSWFVAWRAERNAIRSLSGFSDEMLKDIGLTRGEIPDLVRYGREETYRRFRN